MPYPIMKIGRRANSQSQSIVRCLRFLLGLGALSVCLMSKAFYQTAQADILFTDRAAFEAGLPSGYFFNDFSTAPDAIFDPVGSYSISGGSPEVGYTFTAPPGGLFIATFSGDPNSPKFIGPWEDIDDLVINFNTNNVFRAGIEIFIEDFDNRLAGDVTVDFSNGVSTVVNVPDVGDYAFIGIYSDTVLTSMTIRAVGGGVFTNTTSMYAAIPEPSSLMLCGVAMGALALRRRPAR